MGANTAELGALGLPMIVLLPTQHLEVMQMWDGVLGLLARLPLLRRIIGVALTRWRLRRRSLLAWPNIAAGRAVVPERVGEITPEAIASEAADWLDQPQRLAGMRDDLRSLRGQPGAVGQLASLIQELLAGDPPTPRRLAAGTTSPLQALADRQRLVNAHPPGAAELALEGMVQERVVADLSAEVSAPAPEPQDQPPTATSGPPPPQDAR